MNNYFDSIVSRLNVFFRIQSLILFLSIGLVACGAGESNDRGGDTGAAEQETVTVSGNITIPDGSTPAANATVYIAGGSAASSQKPILGTDCPLPPENYITATCTLADGSFEIEVAGSNTVEFRVVKGAFSLKFEVNLAEALEGVVALPTAVALSNELAEGGANIAVVTGLYDSIENVLAKSGLGGFDSTGALVLGTETFDLYDGDNSLTENYPGFAELLEKDSATGNANIFNYDIVFINCGAREFSDSFYGLAPEAPRTKEILRDYVELGGRLYVTDLAYDFVEQTFPEFIDFYSPHGEDADHDPHIAEPLNDAEQGESDIVVEEADILNIVLQDYLMNVGCGDDNDEACLNENETMHVEGFLFGWAVMNGAHEGAEGVTFYTQGEVDTFTETDVVKPLMVSFDVGAGRVFYSSYHTEDINSSGLLPQERTLQFLIFE